MAHPTQRKIRWTSTPAPKPWRDNQIVLRNGVAIRALGATQGLRGMKHNQYRPGLIIGDDLEDIEQVLSAEQRDKLSDWFNKTLLKAGTMATNVIVIGTILHHESLLARLTDPKGMGWQGRIYRAVESFSDAPELWAQWEGIYARREEYEGNTGPEAAAAFYHANQRAMLVGTKVLWPERESYLDLMLMRMNEGQLSFQSEKQNDPIAPGHCVFDETKVQYWDDQYRDPSDLMAMLGQRARRFVACDPALGGVKGDGDHTAIVTVVQDSKSKLMYVTGAEIGHYTPDETIERIIQICGWYSPPQVLVESSQFQQMLLDQLNRRASYAGVFIHAKGVTHSGNKEARLGALEPLITRGQLLFSRKHPMLLGELREFPRGRYDDGLDALEMAVAAIHRRWHQVIVEQM